MKSKIVNGVLITPTLTINLTDTYAIERPAYSIIFYIRHACKKEIVINQDCDNLWTLITEYHEWELNESNLD